jgi:hypothetical protein
MMVLAFLAQIPASHNQPGFAAKLANDRNPSGMMKATSGGLSKTQDQQSL